MFALNLSADNRILSATFEQYASPGQPLVEELPDGNIVDYRYENNEYIYDPLPEPEPPPYEPTADDLMDILLGVSE